MVVTIFCRVLLAELWAKTVVTYTFCHSLRNSGP